ncbi:Rrf2 family transcriptional regulator [Planomonospora sp. ID91781]|uniref:RrF2 family transcriptional regulator n=1 Tax=Planomonospora sp. ID91781 TaxID=2738135 RepID=UPI0018C3D802|nr:Rrf2 family transcriptional regulator [Planomonospora sp. ID91781]MBG0825035.1 Rrf2 family transcriptional regulator [Planomonospora sp. ID91781]
MRLTAFTDISLRIVMRLAVAGEGELLTTRVVADMLAVPYTHAAKAVARLSELGLVEARRGRGGGMRLSEAGRGASVGGVVRALEGADDVVGCEDDPPCPLRAACRLRAALRQAQEAFYASLDAVTVDSLVAAPTGPVLLSLTSVAEQSLRRPDDPRWGSGGPAS